MLARSITGEDDPDSLSDTYRSRWRRASVMAQGDDGPAGQVPEHERKGLTLSFEEGGNCFDLQCCSPRPARKIAALVTGA
jgi:hypothetical protein